jgi:hypothetical protein
MSAAILAERTDNSACQMETFRSGGLSSETYVSIQSREDKTGQPLPRPSSPETAITRRVVVNSGHAVKAPTLTTLISEAPTAAAPHYSRHVAAMYDSAA